MDHLLNTNLSQGRDIAADRNTFRYSDSLHIPTLTNTEFDFFSKMIQSLAGIHIPREKIQLLEGRLRKRLRALKLSSYGQYKQYLKQDTGNNESQLFVNELTTNKTEFFREDSHYGFLKETLQCFSKTDTVYIWSAACSTGEEVYSLAMLCEELRLDHPAFDYRILGSDIDTRCLQNSRNGNYEKESLVKVPSLWQEKYFELNDDKSIRVSSKLRRRVKFSQHNLVDYKDVIPLDFNIVFIRNVLFYFSKPTATKIVQKIADRLVPGGLIFVSLTESLSSMDVGLTQLSSSVYQKSF